MGNFDIYIRAVPHRFSACERAEISKAAYIDKVECVPSGLWDQHPGLIRFAIAKGLKLYH